MSSSYVKVSLNDSVLKGTSVGSTIKLYAEYPNGQYSDSSLVVSSSSVTQPFVSSSSHPGHFYAGSIKRYDSSETYTLNHRNGVSQRITTDNRNWDIDNHSYSTSATDTVTCGAGNDTISYVDVVNAGAGNDCIYIKGGTVRGGTGNDSIRCETPSSENKQNVVVFESKNGNDTITGYVDVIQWETGFTGLSVGRYYDSYFSPSRYKNYLGLHSGKDSVTLGTNDKFVKIASSAGTELARVYLHSEYNYYTNYSSTVDGSNYNSLEVIIGNSQSETIIAGGGGSSLWGGVGGDDSLSCGAGSDYIFFGDKDGIDYVTNSSAADRVVLYGSLSFQSVAKSGNDLVIQYAPDNKLTVQNWSESGMNSFQINDGSVWGIHFNNGKPTYYRKGK